MSTFRKLDQNIPKIVIDNEDDSFTTFIRLFMKSGLIE
jgi:hypothetical protein